MFERTGTKTSEQEKKSELSYIEKGFGLKACENN
jgi:hypothetical protein